MAFLDAPISGMEARAVDGTLTVMCGGAREVFDRVKPLLDHIGNKILLHGPDRQRAAHQADQPAAVRHQCRGAGRSAADGGEDGPRSRPGRRGRQQRHRPQLRLGVLHPAHPARAFRRRLPDGRTPTRTWSAAPSWRAKQCMPMPVLAAATATYQTALLRGHGEQDKGAMVQVFEELLGVEFRSRIPQSMTELDA